METTSSSGPSPEVAQVLGLADVEDGVGVLVQVDPGERRKLGGFFPEMGEGIDRRGPLLPAYPAWLCLMTLVMWRTL